MLDDAFALLGTTLLRCTAIGCLLTVVAAAPPAVPQVSSATFTVIGVGVDAQSRVMAALKELTQDPLLGRRYKTVVPFGQPLFPSDEDIVAFLPGDNPDLAQWVKLPKTARKYDLLILPDVDYFWDLVAPDGGRKIKFSAEFVLHFQSLQDNRSVVTVLQNNARVLHGKRFRFLGRAGPGMYLDIESVAPPMEASLQLARSLSSLAVVSQ